MAKKIIITEDEEYLYARVALMTNILMEIFGCKYSDAYKLIIKTKTYRALLEKRFGVCYDSPQANLCDIGKELRDVNDRRGDLLTSKHVAGAMWQIRQHNLMKKALKNGGQ